MASAVEKERAAAVEAEKRLRAVHARSEQLTKVRATSRMDTGGSQGGFGLRAGCVSLSCVSVELRHTWSVSVLRPVGLSSLEHRTLPQAERELQKAMKGMEELEAEVGRKKEASRTVKALRAQIAAAEVRSCSTPHASG